MKLYCRLSVWELAVGYPPWSGLSLSELLSRVVLEDLRPPLPDWLPRGLVQLVQVRRVGARGVDT